MKLPKIDVPVVIETAGVALVTYGVFLLFPPLSFIALGSFLIWAVERE